MPAKSKYGLKRNSVLEIFLKKGCSINYIIYLPVIIVHRMKSYYLVFGFSYHILFIIYTYTYLYKYVRVYGFSKIYSISCDMYTYL